jgi:NADH-quinone oxidoreductase subunit C/D
VFYHLLSLERNSDIRIKVALNENDLNIPTATNIWPNANWYEREAYDMFGVNFEGHPMLRRILLPTYWEGHPLRKEYSARATEYTPYMQKQAKQGFRTRTLTFCT